jgi:hypothetical protein
MVVVVVVAAAAAVVAIVVDVDDELKSGFYKSGIEVFESSKLLRLIALEWRHNFSSSERCLNTIIFKAIKQILQYNMA